MGQILSILSDSPTVWEVVWKFLAWTGYTLVVFFSMALAAGALMKLVELISDTIRNRHET